MKKVIATPFGFKPIEIEMTAEEISAHQAELALPLPPAPVQIQALNIFEGLPLDIQLQNAGAFALAKHYGEKGDLGKVQAIIQSVVPSPTEQKMKDQILQPFAGGS